MRALVPFLLFSMAAAAPPPALDKLIPLDEAAYQKVVASHRGSVLLVDFWATWCEPCRREMPALVEMEARLRNRGLRVITVSCDEPEQEAGALEFLRRHRVPGPAYIKQSEDDDSFINSVDPKWSGALPALFIYDRQGRMVKSFFGETEKTDVEAALSKLF